MYTKIFLLNTENPDIAYWKRIYTKVDSIHVQVYSIGQESKRIYLDIGLKMHC